MIHYNHFAYGLDLVTKLRLYDAEKERAFHKATNSDSLGSISERLSSINYPVLVAIDGKDADFADNGAEALLKKPQYFFMLLKPVEGDDNDAILAAQEDMEANALQIQARMMQQSERNEEGLTGLVVDSFSIRGIGPIADGLYGVIIGFNIEYGIGTKINADYWV